MLNQLSKYDDIDKGIHFFTDGDTDIVVMKKDMFTVDELDMAECLRMYIDNQSTVWIPTIEISNYSLYKFILFSFREFVRTDSNERDKVFEQLKQSYIRHNEMFAKIARERFDRYDDMLVHQKDCAYLGYTRRENIFALEQGLGKTILGISLSYIVKSRLTLIITPGVVKWQWPTEMMDWGVCMNEITVVDADKKSNIVAPYERFIIINYDLLEKNLVKLKIKNPDLIILDECHKVKNMDSNRTKVLHELQEVTKARLCLLSGTPVTNKTEDIFSYLKLTTHKYGNKKKFEDKFIESFSSRDGKLKTRGKNLVFLNDCISNLMIRRRKSILNLPEKKYHKLIFDITGSMKEEYDMYYNELVDKISKHARKKELDLSLQRLNIISAKSKVKHIISLAETVIKTKHKVYVDEKFIDGNTTTVITNKEIEVDGKVVIFCMNTEPLMMLQEHFKSRCVLIDGSVPMKKRVAIAKLFRKSRTVNVLISQLDAGGIGLNLVNKKEDVSLPPIYTVIHLNFPFTNAQLEQGNDRVHRIGQWHPVDIYYTLSKGTIDEKLLDIIQRKYQDVSTLIEGQKEDIDLNDVDFDELDILYNTIQKEHEDFSENESTVNDIING